jgi:hypothetical protein
MSKNYTTHTIYYLITHIFSTMLSTIPLFVKRLIEFFFVKQITRCFFHSLAFGNIHRALGIQRPRAAG